jgi:DNA-binding LacI/PurR family transcriptional regulator
MDKEITVYYISIVGFNNDPTSAFVDLQLKTVNYAGKEVGEVAARHFSQTVAGSGDLNTTKQLYKVTTYN